MKRLLLFLVLLLPTTCSPALAQAIDSLPPATTITDSDLFTLDQAANSTSYTKVTALSFKQYCLQGWTLASGKTLTVNKTMTLTASADGETLNIGSGGTLGSAAFDAASAFDAAGAASAAQTAAISAAESNAASTYIPRAGSTSITGDLGANGGVNWEITEATGAVRFDGGDFVTDGDGDLYMDGSLNLNGYVNAQGAAYFGAGLQAGDNGTGSPCAFDDGLILTSGYGEMTVDDSTITLGDGMGDGTASFAGDILAPGMGDIEESGAALLLSEQVLHGNGSVLSIDFTNDLLYANDGATVNLNWSAPGEVSLFGGAITLGDGSGAGPISTSGSIAPGNGTASGASIWSGTGAPSSGLGANGDFYFRKDGSTSTHLYFKASGSWAGIL